MINLSIILFALAAVSGLIILIKWLTKKEASRAVIFSHGIIAVVAVVLLLVYALQNLENFPMASIILFLVAALVGLYMFIRDMKGKLSPTGVALTHSLLAVAGFVMLLVFAFA